jgi:hypothetical protein
MPDVAAVEQALSQLRTGYQADGYDLLVDGVTDGVARVRIDAGADACEECLVAKPITEAILKASLRGLPEITAIELTYPTDK